MKIPRFILGNLLLDSTGEVWAIYRLPTTTYPLLPQSAKFQMHRQLADFARGAETDLCLWRVTRLQSGATNDRAQDRTVETYLAVRICTEHSRSLQSQLLGRLLRVGRNAPAALRLARSEAIRLLEHERSVREHVTHTTGSRAAHTKEISWLLHRTSQIGSGEPSIDPHDSGAPVLLVDSDTLIVEPISTTGLSVHATVVEHPKHVTVDTGSGETHHAVLVMGVLPDGLEFPGRAELLSFPIERSDAIVDASVHAAWVSNAVALKRAGHSILDADHANSEQMSTGRVHDSRLERQLTSAVAYKRYLESDDAPPMLRATITFRVAATTVEDLERAISQLTAYVAPVHLARPQFIQSRLWKQSQLPRASLHGTKPQHLTSDQFAALAPQAVEHAGTPTGQVVGTVRSSGKPVRIDLTHPPRVSRPPSVLCVGTLGSGKTVAAQLLALQALWAGSLVVDIDPKPDHNLDQLAELAGRVNVVDLSDTEQHAGLLDPLAITDPTLRDETAASFYCDLLDADAKTRAHIRRAFTKLSNSDAPNSPAFIRKLAAMPSQEAKDAAEQLDVWSQSGLARLALGRRSSQTNANSSDLTVIRCRSLTLPSASTPRSDYTESERVSCATMRLIAALATRLIAGDKTRHKLLIVDEAWLLLASSDGRQLIERINRTGRSENTTLLLATQQLGDAEQIAPLIGTHLIFGVETRGEATAAATLLGIDDSDELARELTTQRAGQAVLRDTDGRLARIQITLPEELLAQLATTPTGAPV